MLTHILIHDFAIVETLDLDLEPGMTVLTGETGAGKSILVDALGLVLGGRADSSVVRHGCKRAEVSAGFDLDDAPSARAWLKDQDLEVEDECLLRRVISTEGRSRAYINGRSVPVQGLRELGEMLVDIHGQHAHQSLLRREVQREVLDGFGQHRALLTKVRNHFLDLDRLRSEYDRLKEAASQRLDRLDMLHYQARELEALDLQPGEIEALEQERGVVANATRLLEAADTALRAVYEDDRGSALALLNQGIHALTPLQSLDQRLDSAVELLDNARIQTEEAGSELRAYLSALEVDPARLDWIEMRLDGITGLARKHRVLAAALPGLLQTLRAEIDTLEHADVRLEQLERSLEEARETYLQSAAELSRKRAATAAKLSKKVSANMQQLGMVGGRFDIALETREGRLGPAGLERVEFLVSANPGQPLRPLNKVASGGELSRIALSIQVLSSRSLRVPCLVFDEVDVGIGGGIAEIVGRLLRELGTSRQVLCVTHLPQVAAQGHHHLQVNKHSDADSTHTGISLLQGHARTEEIARMLGGVKITPQTLAHAEEMIAQGGH